MWTKQEPATTTFNGTDDTVTPPVSYSLTITTETGGTKKATLIRTTDNVPMGDFHFLPSTAFLKDLFSGVGALL